MGAPFVGRAEPGRPPQRKASEGGLACPGSLGRGVATPQAVPRIVGNASSLPRRGEKSKTPDWEKTGQWLVVSGRQLCSVRWPLATGHSFRRRTDAAQDKITAEDAEDAEERDAA